MADSLKLRFEWLVGPGILRVLSVLLFLYAMAGTKIVYAQSGPTDGANASGRRVILRVKPDYSVLLRGSNIGGTVKLSATVLPNGTVAKVSVLGGNPILAESAAKAVMQWKFVPGPTQTSEAIQLDFH
jgi:TonB family protein